MKPWEKAKEVSNPSLSGKPWDVARSKQSGDYWKSSLYGSGDASPRGFFQNADYIARKGVEKGMQVLDIPNQLAGRPIRMAREALTGRPDPNPPQGFIQEVTGGIQGLTRIPTAMIQGQSPSEALQTASQEVTRTKNQPMDVVNQMAFGIAAPEVAGVPYKATGILGKKLLAPARILGRKALSFISDVPEESITYRAKNPQAVRNAKDVAQLAEEDVPRVAETYRRKIKEYSDSADKAISRSRFLKSSPTDKGGAITKDEVNSVIKTARREIGGIETPDDQAAANYLQKIMNNLKKYQNTVSQKRIYTLMKKLDKKIPWRKIERGEQLNPTEKVQYELRKGYDRLLKGKNKEYADIMKDQAETIRARNKFVKKFGLEKDFGGEYQGSDTTAGKLSGSTRPERLSTRRILDKTKEITGEDLAPQAKADRVKADFEPPERNTVKDIGFRDIFGKPTAQMATDAYGMAKQGYKNLVRPMVNYSPLVRPVQLTIQDALNYLRQANGDPDEARRLAIQDGKQIPE